MASIKKRSDGRYRARYRDPAGKEHAKHFARKIDAQRWLDEVTSSLVTSTYVDPRLGKISVDEWSRQWIASKVNLKASTRDRYAGILATHIHPTWGSVKLCDVTHDGLQTWIAGLTSSGQAGWSVVKIHRVMSMVLGYAVKAKRLATNSALDLDLPKVGTAEKRYVRPQQVANLAEAAGPGRLVVLVLAYIGLRWGELAALKVARLDLMRRRIHVAESVTEVDGGKLDWGLPKDHERRWVPVPRFLVDGLASHLAGRGRDDLVFTSPRGAVLRVGGARRSWFNRAVELAGTAVSTLQGALRMAPAQRDGVYGPDTEQHVRDWQAKHGLLVDGLAGPKTWASLSRAWSDERLAAYGVMTLGPRSQDFPTDFHPHELRHTAASLAVSAGANVKAVQRMLGHAKASMTLDVYADLFDDDLEAVADRLDEIARRADFLRTDQVQKPETGQAKSA